MPPLPSEADRVMCERTGLPWLIVNWPTGAVHQFTPSGYQAPLIGRPFYHGVLGCYTLIRDYYQRELQIDLPDYARAPELSGCAIDYRKGRHNIVQDLPTHPLFSDLELIAQLKIEP